MYQATPLGEQPGTRPAPAAGDGRAIEDFATRQRDAVLRDCAGIRVLEWLDRFSPAERVCHWEKVLRVLPNVFRFKAESDRRVRDRRLSPTEAGAMLARLLERMGYPRGYALGSEADEMARARCKLAQARWAFCAAHCYGPALGRRLRLN
jgi:hypothetical protein